jgi:hypothetical protein
MNNLSLGSGSRAVILLAALLLLAILPGSAVPAGSSATPGLGTTAESGSRQFVVGLSPYLDRSVKDDLFRRVVGFVLEELPLGASLRIYDAFELRTIAEIRVPNTLAFRSGRTRANQFGEPIRRLREFLAVTNAVPAEVTVGAVRLPQFLDFLAAEPGRSARDTVVMLIGSPLYADAKEPGFSMLDGYVPTDGHLAASREETVYGLRERRGTLDGVTLHCGYFGDPWVSDVHQDKVVRFWRLYLAGQGGRLGAFTGDLATLFRAASSPTDSLPAVSVTIDPAQTKISMVRVTRNPGVADWITRDLSGGGATTAPTHTTGPLKIGIRWAGGIDLDLYARPRAGAETLFFQHPRSPEGYYFKDHRSSPEREFEFIEFESPVNVLELDARVNFFEGDAPEGADGEVRIEFDGRIYSGRFSIAGTHGNQGRTGPNQRGAWARIDVAGLLKLRTTTARRAD